ncbi:MAG: DUF2062 domain-containing protein [Nitrococcus sp.]|nr:DUF2062 domain-containing protein [Nitrococcus sp.]
MTAVRELRRGRIGRSLAEMHYHLRTDGDTPARKAGAVFAGVLVGCSPLYGLHLPMCIGIAQLARLNIVITYLAAYVNNPLMAPLILYLELGVGSWLFSGRWPMLDLDELHAVDLWVPVCELVIGSVVVGLVLGAVLAAITWWFSRRSSHEPFIQNLIEVTARDYLHTGIFNWEYIRGKLRYDPLYLGLLEAGILPQRGRLVDLGCGRGLLLALLQTARGLRGQGVWRSDWPPPPGKIELIGIDAHTKKVAVAREVLSGAASIVEGDLIHYFPPSCDVAVLLDVLLYLEPYWQQKLIARVVTALVPGGILLIREADVDAGWRFTLTRLAERLCAVGRGQWRRRYYYRSIAEWRGLLEGHGMRVTTRPMSAGTPYANVLIQATKTTLSAC